MNETGSPVAGTGPGARLEAARRKQGLHVAALAAQLKVPPARLVALEAERWDELPDATHARALATSVCRVLGIDAAPVLAGMPRAQGPALERVSAGLNQPVRDGGAMLLPRWAWWAAAALLLATAAALALWPRGAGPDGARDAGRPGAEEAAVQAPALLPSAAAPVEASVPATVASLGLTPAAPAAPMTPAASMAAMPAPVASMPVATGPLPTLAVAAGAQLEIRADKGASWISVVDAQGVNHASRLLQKGEVFSLSAAQAPLRLTLGNAPALSLDWRGQAQPLQGYEATRVARLELK
jgi:cytoskeleton protein RodZ